MESQITATDKPDKTAPENKKASSKGVSDPPQTQQPSHRKTPNNKEGNFPENPMEMKPRGLTRVYSSVHRYPLSFSSISACQVNLLVNH
jgi:hypothetical protein